MEQKVTMLEKQNAILLETVNLMARWMRANPGGNMDVYFAEDMLGCLVGGADDPRGRKYVDHFMGKGSREFNQERGDLMSYPFGVVPPCGELRGGCFTGFNVFALEEETQFADHPDEVRLLAEQLRQDKEAAKQFIQEANSGTEISVNGILLTWNDLEQINLLLDPLQTAYAWGIGHAFNDTHIDCFCLCGGDKR